MPDDPPKPATRRRALELLLGAGALCAGAAALGPPLAEVVAVGRRGGGGGVRWVRTVKLADLPEGEPRRVAIVSDERDAWKVERAAQLGSVWLTRKGDVVTALSVTCPHLGCSIARSPVGDGFACPCHDSTFDAEGHRHGGPAPRDMDSLATRVQDGFVEVDFRRYRQGTRERVEIG